MTPQPAERSRGCSSAWCGSWGTAGSSRSLARWFVPAGSPRLPCWPGSRSPCGSSYGRTGATPPRGSRSPSASPGHWWRSARPHTGCCGSAPSSTPRSSATNWLGRSDARSSEDGLTTPRVASRLRSPPRACVRSACSTAGMRRSSTMPSGRACWRAPSRSVTRGPALRSTGMKAGATPHPCMSRSGSRPRRRQGSILSMAELQPGSVQWRNSSTCRRTG